MIRLCARAEGRRFARSMLSRSAPCACVSGPARQGRDRRGRARRTGVRGDGSGRDVQPDAAAARFAPISSGGGRRPEPGARPEGGRSKAFDSSPPMQLARRIVLPFSLSPERSTEIVDKFAGKERGRPRAAQLNLRRRRICRGRRELDYPRQSYCQTARAAAGAGLRSSSRRPACAASSTSAACRAASCCLAKGWPFIA